MGLRTAGKGSRPKRKPKPIKLPKLVNQLNRFATIEHMLSQLETGELMEVNGTLAYYDFEEGGHFALVPALGGWIIYVANVLQASRSCRVGANDTSPGSIETGIQAHKALFHALENDILIPNELIGQVKAEVALHKQAYLTLSIAQARDVAIKTRIQIQQQNIAQKDK
jgi:hypothetical protein